LKPDRAAPSPFTIGPSSETSDSSAAGFFPEIISFRLSDHYFFWQEGQKYVPLPLRRKR
jgi:hypothetical protein